ncbi:hypothetical protein PILCRDRAFT_825736 [Piloderma croceum F 1598]|uniref:Uncharacterized protein n=1 Tax=Piloderma croceum (strain F 1598) TaxID=765440 RepID=A0A0C3EWT3_PILCF|nr:hypothetical protein PILCRDRAFT_825736 [Piloderma croceum F 1598]
MNTLTGALNTTSDSLGQGVGKVTTGIGKGLQDGGNAIEQGLGGGRTKDGGSTSNHDSRATTAHLTDNSTNLASDTTKNAPRVTSDSTRQISDTSEGDKSGGIFHSISSGTTAFLSPTADFAKSGAAIIRDSTSSGLSIGQRVAQSGLDLGANVATGTATFAGTALGGVVSAAAETSGAVFEPVGSGLRAIQGLDKLGQGVETINGLSLGAVRQVGALTTKALNMTAMTPKFFDPDGDNIVTVPDTERGLALLGLDEKKSKYAAYALHTVFSYPTSEKWMPSMDTALPIHIANMGKTRWGKNWGSFDRIDWVDDVEIDEFFAPQNDNETWSDSFKRGRQYFGILLLIFEWGTTWPFYIPPVPVQEIPFHKEIGTVVRKAILPTILSNLKRAREADSNEENKKVSAMPSEKMPTNSNDA